MPTEPKSPFFAVDPAALDIRDSLRAKVRSYITPPAQHEPRPVAKKAIEPYVAYLEDPYLAGYWELTATWNDKAPIHAYLTAPLLREAGKEAEANSVESLKRRYQILEHVRTLTRRISAVFAIFDYATRAKERPGEQHALKLGTDITLGPKDFDLAELEKDFAPQLSVFREKLWTADFIPSINDDPFSFRDKVLFLPLGPRQAKKRIRFTAAEREPLQDMHDFLSATDLARAPEINRVFAPEEELLSQYFPYLTLAFDHAVNDERNQPQFTQAFNYYRANDFKHCISSLALIAEDYLAQIYGSFLREQCPLDLTLGQMYDQLHSRVRELMEDPRQQPLSVDEIFSAAKTAQTSQQLPSPDELAQLLRLVATTIKQDRRVLEDRLDQLKGKSKTVSVFPKSIRDRIDEIIRNRNAASHKTRVPLGNYEAQTTLHGIVSLIRWWQRTRKSLAWSEEREKVLRDAIALAASCR